MSEARKTFLSSDKTRKVEVFQRADNTFGFEEFTFGQEEQAWFPVGSYSIAVIVSLERAIKEAMERVAWLSDKG